VLLNFISSALYIQFYMFIIVFTPGWESRMDTHGRVFYIDHNNRTTTWLRPQVTGVDSRDDRTHWTPAISVQERQQLDRRFVCETYFHELLETGFL